jgi:hypothetical protein
MSFSIQLEVKNNQITVQGQSTEVPDGRYSISGHEDSSGRSFSAARYSLEPVELISSAASHQRIAPVSAVQAEAPADPALANA